ALRAGAATIPLGVAGYGLAVLGIVWSINLFNFMDGIDGLAGSQATLIFGSAAALLLARGDRSLAALALVLSAATLGFLPWNWPPARIFMGDVGSGALGYLIAGLAQPSLRERDRRCRDPLARRPRGHGHAGAGPPAASVCRRLCDARQSAARRGAARTDVICPRDFRHEAQCLARRPFP